MDYNAKVKCTWYECSNIKRRRHMIQRRETDFFFCDEICEDKWLEHLYTIKPIERYQL